jgi:hypothetical protein
MAGAHFNKESFGGREGVGFRVKKSGFCPVLAALAADQAPLNANGAAWKHRAQILNFHLARYGCEPAYADGFAHSLIQQGCNNASVYYARRSLKNIRDYGHTYDGLILRGKELQVKSDRVGWAASKATILGRANHWSQILRYFVHRFLDRSVSSA